MKKILLSVTFSLVLGVASAQTITTMAGTGVGGYNGDGGPATSAAITGVYDVATDAAGNKYIASYVNHVVRRIAAGTGIITTICGTGVAGSTGDGGLATAAQVNGPMCVFVDNSNNIYITEYAGNRIRKINAGTGIITTIIGTGVAGYNGNGLLGTATQMSSPWGVTVDAAGNVYYVDRNNYRIRKLTIGTGSVTTIAGTGVNSWTGDGGLATAATVSDALDLCLDNTGNIYWAEYQSHVIRKVTVSSGTITTIAGTGVQGYNGEGVLATNAQLNGPTAVLVDQNLNVFISSYTGHRVRKITAITGSITTITGNGTAAFSGDGGLATSGQVNGPIGLAANYGNGDLYICDLSNNRVRAISNAVTCGPPPAPVSTTQPSQQNICAGSSSTLNAIGSGTINWYATPSSTLVLGTGTAFVTPTLAVGNYTYYAGAQTCTSSATRAAITITVNALPVITVNSGSICSGQSFTIVASGANTYTYSGGSAVVTPSTTMAYSVTGTSSAGCISSNTAISNVTVSATPSITVNSGSVCAGQSFTMVPSGANTYTFSGGNAVVTPTANASYTVTGTSTAGCISASPAIASVSVTALPTVAITGGTTSVCAGQSLSLSASGADTYSWSNGGVTSTIAPTPTANITYTVIGTSSVSGCSANAMQSVTVTAVPVLSVTGGGSVCINQSATLTVSGSDTYSWSTGPTSFTIVVTPSATATYTAFGTSTLTGCSGSITAVVTVDPCTGISQLSSQNIEFVIYPNPSHEIFNVRMDKFSTDTKLKVYNSLGELLSELQINSSQTKLDLSAYANGLYFIKLSSNGKEQTVRIIKD